MNDDIARTVAQLQSEIDQLRTDIEALTSEPEARQLLQAQLASKEHQLAHLVPGPTTTVGDIVAADKIAGDKVLGDKYEQHYYPGVSDQRVLQRVWLVRLAELYGASALKNPLPEPQLHTVRVK